MVQLLGELTVICFIGTRFTVHKRTPSEIVNPFSFYLSCCRHWGLKLSEVLCLLPTFGRFAMGGLFSTNVHAEHKTFCYHKTVCGVRNPAYCKCAVTCCAFVHLMMCRLKSYLIFCVRTFHFHEDLEGRLQSMLNTIPK